MPESGLSRAEFASRVGTSASRLSTYVSGRVTPSAALLLRMRRVADARHLAWLRDEIGDRFLAGVVLHTGPRVYTLGERIVAAPIASLWS